MKKLLCILLLASSCYKIDNYPAPSCTITGATVDEVTDSTLQTEVGSSGGTRVELLQTSYDSNPVPFYFYCMQDGQFNDTKVFAATYNVSVQGPFVPLIQTDSLGNVLTDSTQNIVLTSKATLTFKVQPFLRIQWVGQPVVNPDTTVTVQFIVTRGTDNPSYQQDVTDINVYISNTQYDGNNNYDPRYSVLNSYGGSDGTSLLGRVITMTTTGGALPAQDVYFRVGARTNAGLDEYNYSTPVSITYP